MRRRASTLAVALALVIVAGAYYRLHGHVETPHFLTGTVSTGDVIRHVAATGTLEAVTTVEVGSQVSGTISELGADFNSIVRKGHVLARLDPSLLDTQIASARSAVAKATADADGMAVAVSDAEVKLNQARALHDRKILADADYDAAEVALKTARANLDSARSAAAQAQAALNQALVNRKYTVISSPIDGIVVARNVDIGQTVAASFQAPTLFVLAADLKKMQLNASIDESDIGAVQPGQPVTFSVDAYPQDQFKGVVKQIRLQPVVVQNVVTYSTEILVDNSDLRLKPGMTATLNVETARAADVLKVPNTALRYVPRKGLFAALREPEPRALAEEQKRRPSAATGGTGFVWVLDGGQLRPERVTIGLSDGNFTQVTGSGLSDGTQVVTGELIASAGPMASTPLMPTPQFGRR